MLIDAGYTPVVAPITADAEGEGLLNTNADTVAQTVAVGMSPFTRRNWFIASRSGACCST